MIEAHIKIGKFFRKLSNRLFSKVKYIIAEFNEANKILTFQCNGTRATFRKSLVEMPYEESIILGLDPRQSCFLGIQVGQFLDIETDKFKKTSGKRSSYYDSTRQIDLTIDRYDNVMFFDKITGQPKCISAIDLVKNDEILKNFNPIASYALGILIGKKIRNNYVEYLQNSLDDSNNVINLTLLSRKGKSSSLESAIGIFER